MIYLLFLVTPILALLLLFLINKIATDHWEKNNPDFTSDDLNKFLDQNGSYRNPKDLRIIVKEGYNFQTRLNLRNPILTFILFIMILSFPIVNNIISTHFIGN